MSAYRLEKLYASLPTIVCQGHCHGACGPIACGRHEANRMQDAAGGKPLTYDKQTLTCGYLTEDRRCQVYDVRPLICRLWGVVPEMPCRWGCTPSRELSRAEAETAFRTVERVGGKCVMSKETP